MSEKMIKERMDFLTNSIASHLGAIYKLILEAPKDELCVSALDLVQEVKDCGGIFLPVMLGETVYIIRNNEIKEGTVKNIELGDSLRFSCRFATENEEVLMLNFKPKDIGQFVFLTKEYAELALKAAQSIVLAQVPAYWGKEDKEE